MVGMVKFYDVTGSLAEHMGWLIYIFGIPSFVVFMAKEFKKIKKCLYQLYNALFGV